MRALTVIGLVLAAVFAVAMGSWIVFSVAGVLLDGWLHGCEAAAAVAFAAVLGGGSILFGLVFVAFAIDAAKTPKGG